MRKFTCLLPLLCVCLVMSACAHKSAMPNIKADYYPQCFAPFKELKEYETRLQRRAVGYVAAGATAGAALGAITGLVSGNWQSALAGAIGGAIAGGVTGFSLAKIEEIKDSNKRLVAYRDVMGADLVNATDVQLTALKSLKCYVQEFERLQQDYNAQRITREDYAARYAEIKAAIVELGKITGETQILMAQRDIEMRAALQKEAYRGNPSAEPLASVEQRRAEREKLEKAEAAKRKKAQRRQRRSKKSEMDAGSTTLAMAELNADLDRLTAEAQADKARYQAQQPTPPAQGQKASAVPVTPVDMKQIAATYNDYPDKVLQMEAVEKQRLRSLEIMRDAAAKTGIDMV